MLMITNESCYRKPLTIHPTAPNILDVRFEPIRYQPNLKNLAGSDRT